MSNTCKSFTLTAFLKIAIIDGKIRYGFVGD